MMSGGSVDVVNMRRSWEQRGKSLRWRQKEARRGWRRMKITWYNDCRYFFSVCRVSHTGGKEKERKKIMKMAWNFIIPSSLISPASCFSFCTLLSPISPTAVPPLMTTLHTRVTWKMLTRFECFSYVRRLKLDFTSVILSCRNCCCYRSSF